MSSKIQAGMRRKFLFFALLIGFLAPNSIAVAQNADVKPETQSNAANLTNSDSQSQPQIAPAPVGSAPRAGVPSFLGTIDRTVQIWNDYLSQYPLYLVIIAALIASYFTGRIAFEAAFAMGSFGPGAANFGMWILGITLFFFTVALLPLSWPWWAPWATLLLFIVVLLCLPKKRVA